MTYASKSDLIELFGELELTQLTDRAHKPPTTVDDALVAKQLDFASGVVDGYLGKVYALPLASPPSILVKVTADLARYYLHGKSADKDSPVTRAHAEAIAWLTQVAGGIVKLDVGGAAPQPAEGAAGRVVGSQPVFTRDTLRGY